MKKDLHPTDYRPVVFQDTSSKFSFLTKSTAQTQDEIKWEDGNTYPLVKIHISSASHPFFTGEEKIVDVEGRVDKFKARAEAAKKSLEAKKAAAAKSAKKAKPASHAKSSKKDLGGQEKDSSTQTSNEVSADKKPVEAPKSKAEKEESEEE